MAVRVPELDYYSLHGIWGAYASLALGRIGRGAGVVVGDVKPPRTGLFVGYRAGRDEPRLLPFSSGAGFGLGAAAYHEEPAPQGAPTLEGASFFGAEEMERRVSLSGEEWRAGSLSFRVVSFFGEVPEPRSVPPAVARAALRPSLLLVLGFDNRAGRLPMTGLFGMQGVGRPLSDSTTGGLLGMASGTTFGFATRPGEGVEEVMDWSVVDAAFDGDRPPRRLASEGGLRFTVPAGERVEYVLALGVFRSGVVTAGLPAHAYHSCLFKDLEDVLESAIEGEVESLARAERVDELLDGSGLSDERRFLVAHAAHSYCANTELLLAQSGEPVFVVNEGEYRMMNTLDLTVDQAFWEARYSPWTLRAELDGFAERSAYFDSFGLAFAHDQGVADCFAPKGCSAYEMPGLTDCFSFMSYEETLNWVLSACLYANLSGDLAWARSRTDRLSDCLESILARDADGDGIMDLDSDRCQGGAEITTYDSLDLSLGQARNNLYLAVKGWAALVCIERLFRAIDAEAAAGARDRGPRTAPAGAVSGAAEAAERATPVWAAAAAHAAAAAQAAARSIAGRMLDEGYIPAVFESGNRSCIIPAIEGLAYPSFCGAPEAVAVDGPYGELVRALGQHLETVLAPGVCLDANSGGWKLSSTSHNTWLSKIFLNQYVAERVLGIADERTMRDAVHARWLRTGSADFAATDQVDSSSGRDLGSRLYPRLVTSILWLEDSIAPRRTFR